MDQNSNVNLKVVQGNFPIKYGPKKPKQKIRKYAYLRIFSLTTSKSPKLIPKAYLK